MFGFTHHKPRSTLQGSTFDEFRVTKPSHYCQKKTWCVRVPSTENWKNINTFNYQHLGPFSFGWLGTSYRQKLVSVCKQTNVYRRFEGREQLKRILTDKMTVYLSCWLVTNQFVEDYYISFIIKVNKYCVEHLYICKVILKVSQTFIRLFTSYLSMHTKSRWLSFSKDWVFGSNMMCVEWDWSHFCTSCASLRHQQLGLNGNDTGLADLARGILVILWIA